MAKEEEKGSKEGILTLIDSDDFKKKINELLKGTGAEISDDDFHIPVSKSNGKEAQLKGFLKEWSSEKKEISKLSEKVRNWWLVKGNQTPHWDLITTCNIDGKKGLLLVEAKAHRAELTKEWKGKDPVNVNDSSEGSILNDEQIGNAIDEAKNRLNDCSYSVGISKDNCYQLSNRIAHAWWLANEGIPVVLLYLGFLNVGKMDTYKVFENDADWQNCFLEHASKVGITKDHLDKKVQCNKSSFRLISGSLDLNS